MRQFAAVVAVDDELGIGKGGDLPWRVPADMAHFKTLTLECADGYQNAVIMGRKTWQSIPTKFRPLVGRRNIVLSRKPALELPEGVIACSTVVGALDECGPEIESLFVIGGATIYAQVVTLEACRSLYVTRIAGTFGCDTHFPAFEAAFHLAEVMDEGDSGGHHYRVERWDR